MKSILDLFRSRGAEPAPNEEATTAAVRRIVRELDQLEPQRARYLAAFAYLLGRVANADLEVSDEETRAMEEIVERFGELPAEQAVLVVGIARTQNRLFGGTQSFQVAREFRDLSTPEERRELLRCLFAVSAADDEVSGEEEAQVRQIADELDLTHGDYIAARREVHHLRSVVKRLGRKKKPARE